jgi:glycine reductase
VYIGPTGTSPVDLPDILSRVFQIAQKLTSGEEMGPAETEGYLGRGIRKVSERSEPGYKRAVDMLASKLRGETFQTEVPFEAPEAVPAASLQRDLSQATIALISTGGLIPIGNPDRQVSGNAERYFSYPVDGLESLTGEDWEAFHGGYYNQIASDNPNYILPLSHLRHLESQGVIGRIASQIITLPGVSTPVAKSKLLGAQMAQELKDAGVDACILVAT